MKNKIKKQITPERIDDFFHQIIEFKDSGHLEKFLNFIKKLPQHAPFNSALVFVQNPDCSYYATEKEWHKFDRYIKKRARPMLILFPFAPVEFVYDISDTKGDNITDEKLLFWWREEKYHINEKILENTIENCERIKISVSIPEGFDYIKRRNLHTMGVASLHRQENKREITLHPKYLDKEHIIEAYGVLCHEIAHHLLGHLGEIAIDVPSGKNEMKRKIIAESRTDLGRQTEELEAELVAWIVFSALGIEKNSVPYMAQYIVSGYSFSDTSISQVLTIANKIKDMGFGVLRWR